MIEYWPGYFLLVGYPLIPWVGVMAAGYCLGPLFLQAIRRSQTVLWLLGFLCIMMFLFLRLGNIYGDPRPWVRQNDLAFTVFAILNCQKYPPSLLYLLMTLGIMFVGLAMFEGRWAQRFGKPLITIGKAPLFFYLLHIFLIHGAALSVTHLRGLPVDWLLNGSPSVPFPKMPSPDFGFDLPVVYIVWLALVVLLYPLCYGFVLIKRRYGHIGWLSYL